jgi:hypothetical protein
MRDFETNKTSTPRKSWRKRAESPKLVVESIKNTLCPKGSSVYERDKQICISNDLSINQVQLEQPGIKLKTFPTVMLNEPSDFSSASVEIYKTGSTT